MKKIGVLGNFFSPERPGATAPEGAWYFNRGYTEAFKGLGALCILAPYLSESSELREFLSMVDGVLFTGGFDLPASLSLNDKSRKEYQLSVDEERLEYELQAFDYCQSHGIPCFGICLGMQLFCLARGGSLYPHIPDFFEDCLDHRMNSKDLRIAGHCIKIKEHSRLFQWLAKEKCQVNSSHHQAVHTPGKGVILSAVAEDGVIEAVEAEDGSFTGVQWHPESLFLKSREQRSLFANFVASL